MLTVRSFRTLWEEVTSFAAMPLMSYGWDGKNCDEWNETKRSRRCYTRDTFMAPVGNDTVRSATLFGRYLLLCLTTN